DLNNANTQKQQMMGGDNAPMGNVPPPPAGIPVPPAVPDIEGGMGNPAPTMPQGYVPGPSGLNLSTEKKTLKLAEGYELILLADEFEIAQPKAPVPLPIPQPAPEPEWIPPMGGGISEEGPAFPPASRPEGVGFSEKIPPLPLPGEELLIPQHA